MINSASQPRASLLLVAAVCLPLLVIPWFLVYLPAGLLVPGGYELLLINENQKYAAELATLAMTVLVFVGVQAPKG